MGRIIAQTTITNRLHEDKAIRCGVLVDALAGALILPQFWKVKLGRFLRTEPVRLLLTNQQVISGEACAPVEIKIEGFRPVWNEVVFLDAESEGEEDFEPLLGYVILVQAQAAVDTVGHWLTPVPYIDMKRSAHHRSRTAGSRPFRPELPSAPPSSASPG